LAIQIRQHFHFAADWYRSGSVVALVLAYYVVLRSIVSSQPELRQCRTRCRHCRIFFITHPRNAGRGDLRCPFGCREAHRKAQSNRRSTAYYRDEKHKEKKRQLNAKRRKAAPGASAPMSMPTPAPAADAPLSWPRPMVNYLCMVVGLIERRRVGVEEILAMLARTLRQHRMVRGRRMDQTVASLHERPP
jgi:hypothetical protein